MKICLEIKADTNDADYVTSRNEISTVDLLRVQRIASLIKKDSYNWNYSEYCDKPEPAELYKDTISSEDIEWFGQFVPYGDGGSHTIERISVLYIADEVKLL